MRSWSDSKTKAKCTQLLPINEQNKSYVYARAQTSVLLSGLQWNPF